MKHLYFLLGIILSTMLFSCSEDVIYSGDGYSYSKDDISGVVEGIICDEYTEDGETYVYLSVRSCDLKHPNFDHLPGVAVKKDEMTITDYKEGDIISFRITKIYKIKKKSDFPNTGWFGIGTFVAVIVGKIKLCD